MAAKGLILLGLLVLVIGYVGYIEYPEPCDFPVIMKAYYSLMRLVTTTSYAWHRLGGSYVSIMRNLENVADIVGGENVTITKHTFGGVPTTIFSPLQESIKKENSEEPGIVFFHGGGWAVGGVELYGAFARSLAKHSGMKVVFPEYRLAPENPYPAGLEDCISATLDFASQSSKFGISKDKLMFVGDSAGGNLAVAVSLSLATRNEADIEPCHMSLIYPLLQMSNFMLPSYRQNAKAPLLTPEIVARFVVLYMGIQNFTDIIQPMTHNFHMEGIESDGFANKIDSTLVPEQYKRQMPALPPYKPNLVETEAMKKYKRMLQMNAADPLFSPLSAKDDDLKLLPDTNILTSEFDVLRDDGLILYERMKSLDLDVTYRNMEFGTHGIANLFGAANYHKLTKAMMEFVNQIKDESTKC